MAADEQTIPSVWARPRKREQPALSRAQIVAEAVRLLDADGLEALSMRKLGTRLDAGATSLYRHVANRDELIELVVDEVYGEIRVPEVADPDNWREPVTACARSVRSMILRHPWIASVLGEVGLSHLGPNVMRLNDRMLALLEAAGFPADEADRAISAIVAYVTGMGISEAAWLTTVARSGQSEREWAERLRPAAERAAEPYPRLRNGFSAQTSPRRAREEKFDYGLERILDGLETRRG
ncbi:TetR/AcrR family transcriptional regulator [Amycolatopsis anabasis]|uniref:TetR/AcrR family transcriptional regulator n=1 Tax=Amycolatopsis anabasis TaxID=1840409 RepID=UPI00131CFFBB|nr:TetR/AcrR family transcriptional regulator [Amycolatopsis anabasis]